MLFSIPVYNTLFVDGIIWVYLGSSIEQYILYFSFKKFPITLCKLHSRLKQSLKFNEKAQSKKICAILFEDSFNQIHENVEKQRNM